MIATALLLWGLGPGVWGLELPSPHPTPDTPYPIPAPSIEPQPLPAGVADNGINVLLDNAHDLSFAWMWDTQDALRNAGFRVTGSQATLDTVLTPGKPSRVREQSAHAFEVKKRDGTVGQLHRPFVMLPNPRYNVLLTYQFGRTQSYLPEEVAAVRKFVEQGCGLVAVGAGVELGRVRVGVRTHPETVVRTVSGRGAAFQLREYPMREMMQGFGAILLPDRSAEPYSAADHPAAVGFKDMPGAKWATAKVDSEWTPLIKGVDGGVVMAARSYGKGRIVLFADPGPYQTGKQEEWNVRLLASALKWAAGKPVGGSRAVPWEYGGVGGAIYPELTTQAAGVTVFYARNQMPGVLDAVRNRTREVKALLDKWLPSPPLKPGQFFIIPAAGSPGSGWAVNVYTPKEAQICSHDADINALLSVMAHEITHTMPGPAASDGSVGGVLPGLFSEAHAGWFQRKAGVALGWAKTTLDGVPALDSPQLKGLDLSKVPDAKTADGWCKLWRMWQSLEDRYGEMWYANWMRTIHERYRKDRRHQLTWPEVAATMSDAVHADLFPLFREYDTPLTPPPGWKLSE